MSRDIISSIATELLVLILEYVDDTFPRTVARSCITVNRRFSEVAHDLLYRRQVFDFYAPSIPWTEERIGEWLKRPKCLRSIRHVIIFGNMRARSVQFEEGETNNGLCRLRKPHSWAPLVQLITKASRIKRLDFDYPGSEFPLALLQALEEYHPKARLYIWNYDPSGKLRHEEISETALECSPLLRKAEYRLKFPGLPRRPGKDVSLYAYERIILNAPNLEAATIFSKLQPREENEWSSNGLPTIPSSKAKPTTSIKMLTFDHTNLGKATLEGWEKIVSFEHVETLNCHRSKIDQSFLDFASGAFRGLKSIFLDLWLVYPSEGTDLFVNRFLSQLLPLDSLCLWNWRSHVLLGTILRHHGSSLRSLELHDLNGIDDYHPKPLLPDELKRIRAECPKLEGLAVDMKRRHMYWREDFALQKDILDELCDFGPRLRRVQINIDIGTDEDQHRWNWFRLDCPPVKEFADDFDDDDDDEDRYDEDDKACPFDSNAPRPAMRDLPPASPDEYPGPFLRPSHDDMQEHAEFIWGKIMGHPSRRNTRHLEVNWGEWGSYFTRVHPLSHFRMVEDADRATRILVFPKVRDDKLGQPTTKLFKKQGLQNFMKTREYAYDDIMWQQRGVGNSSLAPPFGY